METREKLVHLADQLIRKRGYNAFSYKDLSLPLQVKNAAVHYYFPSKPDLGVAVVDQSIEKFVQHIEQWSRLPENEQLQHFARTYAQSREADLICLMGSLAPDYQTLPEAVQVKVKEMGQGILDWVTTCLENGRKRRLFYFSGDSYDRALLVVSTFLSALLLSRVLGGDTFDRMLQQLLADLNKQSL